MLLQSILASRRQSILASRRGTFFILICKCKTFNVTSYFSFAAVISTLFNFVRMFKQAHEENCKQLELEKKKAEKEAVTEKLKINASEKEIGHSIHSQVKSIK